MAHLRQILDKYKDEIVDSTHAESDRQGLFSGLESGLKSQLAKMERMSPRTTLLPDGKSQVPPKPGLPVNDAPWSQGRVKQLVTFHQQQISNVGAIDKQGELVIRLRQWLFRQGATLTRNGDIVWSKSGAQLKYDVELAQQELTRIAIRGGRLFTTHTITHIFASRAFKTSQVPDCTLWKPPGALPRGLRKPLICQDDRTYG